MGLAGVVLGMPLSQIMAFLDAGGSMTDLGIINVTDPTYGAAGDDSTSNTAAFQRAIADAQTYGSPIYLPPTWNNQQAIYRTGTALTPFSGMRMVSFGRGSEFDHSAILKNTSTDIFTPTGDVTDMHIEGIQFQGNGGTLATDWWTVGTGHKITFSTIRDVGFEFFRRVYHGQWIGVTFKDFYVNNGNTSYSWFNVTGSDCLGGFGPGFIGDGGYTRTTLTAGVTAGAGPKTITVADPTGAAVGNPVYIGDPTDPTDGPSATRDVTTISAIAGSDITVGTLSFGHSSGDNVHFCLDTPVVESQLSHSLITGLYISPAWGMALHVTGGHSSNYFSNDLSGVPIESAGPGIYVVNSAGHQFKNNLIDSVARQNWSLFNGGFVVYDSVDLNIEGTIWSHMYGGHNLYRLGRSGSPGVDLTDRIRIAGTTYYDNTGGTPTKLSGNAAMTAASVTVDFDEFPITKAGAPTDADFYSLARDGLVCTDTTNSRIYTRVSGTWKYAALT